MLSELSRCGWESLKDFFKAVVPEKDAVPGSVIAVQTFGDLLGFHPHSHILCTDRCFYGDPTAAGFRVAPLFKLKRLAELFRHKVFKALPAKGKITEAPVGMLIKWRHSGFNGFCGPGIQPRNQETMENLSRYIIRTSFSQERMTYIPETSEIIYRSKDGKGGKVFDALEGPAAMCPMFPTRASNLYSTLWLRSGNWDWGGTLWFRSGNWYRRGIIPQTVSVMFQILSEDIRNNKK